MKTLTLGQRLFTLIRQIGCAIRHVRYHIDVPCEYWERTYGAIWEKATDDERKIIRQGFLEHLMKGLDRQSLTAMAVMTDSWTDNNGNQVGITIRMLSPVQPVATEYKAVDPEL